MRFNIWREMCVIKCCYDESGARPHRAEMLPSSSSRCCCCRSCVEQLIEALLPRSGRSPFRSLCGLPARPPAPSSPLFVRARAHCEGGRLGFTLYHRTVEGQPGYKVNFRIVTLVYNTVDKIAHL